MNAEQSRLEEARTKKAPWKKWGPYLSERQWGTVREATGEEEMTQVLHPSLYQVNTWVWKRLQ